MKGAARGIAGFLRSDRSSQTKLRMRAQVFALSAGGCCTEIHVLMPLRNAERNALVQFILAETLGRGVHHANQFVIVTMLLIEQRGRMLGIKTKARFHRVAVVSEVVHL